MRIASSVLIRTSVILQLVVVPTELLRACHILLRVIEAIVVVSGVFCLAKTQVVIAANARDASADFSTAMSDRNKIFTPAKDRARRILHHQTEGICGLALIVCALRSQ